MDTLPSITIVLPAFNEERNIRFCLAGISTLYYPKAKIELIVVDNGSTDDTVKIAQEYGATVFSIPGVTIATLRNFGWKKSQGEYIAFLDADCIPNKSWLYRSIENLNKLPGAVAVSGVLALDAEAIGNEPWIEKLWIDYLRSKHPEKLSTSNTLASFCFCISKKHLEMLNGFNEDLTTCEDSDLGYRLTQIGIIYIDSQIEIIHLGNAKTIKEFFLRQFWQGSSNLLNLRAHKITLHEIPSIGIPLLFCCAIIMASLCSLFWVHRAAFILWILVLCVPFFVTLRKKTGSGVKSFFQYYTIWFIYLLARGSALFFSFILLLRT